MSGLAALAGLLGGVNSGLNNYVKVQSDQENDANRARLTAIQVAAERRAQQAQEFEKLKAQYNALNPDQELTAQDAQPFLTGGFRFQKGVNGGLVRPKSVEENVALQGLDINFLKQKAAALYGPQAEAQAAEGTADRANRLLIAQEGNQNDLATTGMQTAATKYSADAMNKYRSDVLDQRDTLANAAALNRPIVEKDYQTWKLVDLPKDQATMQHMKDALAAGVPQAQIEMTLRKMYAQSRAPFAETPK